MYNSGIHAVLYGLQGAHNIINIIVCPRHYESHANNKLGFSFLNSYNYII